MSRDSAFDDGPKPAFSKEELCFIELASSYLWHSIRTAFLK
jgi:hypothetical protein